MFPFIEFGMLSKQMAMERLDHRSCFDWLQFTRIINKLEFALHTIYVTQFALINYTSFSPAICTQVQQNLLLLYSNIPPTSVNTICPAMSSPLPRYHDENIRDAHRSVPHSFPGKRSLNIVQSNF